MLCFESAAEIVRLVLSRQVSAREVMSAHLYQIERLNPEINAICTLAAEQAQLRAAELDRALARGADPGPLCGLPVAVKDLTIAKGLRTTYGSPIYKDYIPDRDALFVERFKAAGAIVIGKTNTPEFGAGSHTFNEVFGATRNPYDPNRSAGGSSGGAAAALASRMVPIADGSDLGGSVRNPANFCNVVGLRPCAGRVPRYPREEAWDTLSVVGPMARSVTDVALLLSVMAGPDARDPISITEPAQRFRQLEPREFKGARVAWSPDLGQFPVEPAVLDVIRSALPRFEEMGCVVEQDHPDFSGAGDIFQVLRAHSFAAGHALDLAQHRDMIKDTVIWNIEQGLKLSGQDVSNALVLRAALYHRVRRFFDRYDFLLLPVSQVVPFALEDEWVKEIDGKEMKTYIDWMMSCSLITVSGHPAMSVPCGFTRDGMPVGIQIVGRYREEGSLLQFAHGFEQLTRFADQHPELATTAE